MSGAQNATAELQTAMEMPLKAVAVGVGMARNAQASLRDADDVVLAMQAAVGLVLACEMLAENAETAGKAARLALAAAMSDTGATTIVTDGHVTSLRDGARSVVISDPGAISPDFMRQRDPEPDKVLISKALRDGYTVAGAALSNGGPQTISIRSKSQ